MTRDQHGTRTALEEVERERARQDQRWGQQDHADQSGGYFVRPLPLVDDLRSWLVDAPAWDLILLEEVAEAWEAIGDDRALRAELVQVAAVAVAWIEALDRRGQR